MKISIFYRVTFLIITILFVTQTIYALDKNDPLAEGKKLSSFTVVENKKKITFPDDYEGEPFVLYFGNIIDENDGYEFLSWGGGFTISLRQEDEEFHNIFFAGIASLRERPLYWFPFLVRKTFIDNMSKHDVRGEIYFDFPGDVAKKFHIGKKGVRAIIVDKKGIIRKSFDKSVYKLTDKEQEEIRKLYKVLLDEIEEKDEG